MSPETIGALFTGLTGLITGLAAFVANRNRVIGENQKALKAHVRVLQQQILATAEHVFTLEMQLATHGIGVPARPAILESDDDDDQAPALAPRTHTARHHRQA